MSYFLEMSSEDKEKNTVEPSIPLLSEPGFVAETPCYSFEVDEEGKMMRKKMMTMHRNKKHL